MHESTQRKVRGGEMGGRGEQEMIHYGSEAFEIHWRIVEPFLVVRSSSPLLRKTFIPFSLPFGKDRLKLPPKKRAETFSSTLSLVFQGTRRQKNFFLRVSSSPPPFFTRKNCESFVTFWEEEVQNNSYEYYGPCSALLTNFLHHHLGWILCSHFLGVSFSPPPSPFLGPFPPARSSRLLLLL